MQSLEPCSFLAGQLSPFSGEVRWLQRSHSEATVSQASPAAPGVPLPAPLRTNVEVSLTPHLFGLHLASSPLTNPIVSTGWEVVRVSKLTTIGLPLVWPSGVNAGPQDSVLDQRTRYFYAIKLRSDAAKAIFFKFTVINRNWKSNGHNDSAPFLEFRSPVLIDVFGCLYSCFIVSNETPRLLLFGRWLTSHALPHCSTLSPGIVRCLFWVPSASPFLRALTTAVVSTRLRVP